MNMHNNEPKLIFLKKGVGIDAAAVQKSLLYEQGCIAPRIEPPLVARCALGMSQLSNHIITKLIVFKIALQGQLCNVA